MNIKNVAQSTPKPIAVKASAKQRPAEEAKRDAKDTVVRNDDAVIYSMRDAIIYSAAQAFDGAKEAVIYSARSAKKV